MKPMRYSPLQRPRRKSLALAALLFGLPLVGAASLHLELVDSYPKKDQTVANPPIDISLIFSESADPTTSTVKLHGPDGEDVELGPMVSHEEGLVLSAEVKGDMGRGRYTVEWMASAPDVLSASGNYHFTVGRER